MFFCALFHYILFYYYPCCFQKDTEKGWIWMKLLREELGGVEEGENIMMILYEK